MACLNFNGILRSEIEAFEIETIPAYPLTSFYNRNAIAQVFQFARDLKRRQIQIVQAHDFYTNVLGMVGAAIAGVAVRIGARRKSAERPALHRTIEKIAYSFSHAVVANCDEVRRQLVQEGVASRKITTIYDRLDLRRVTPERHTTRQEVLSLFGLPQEEDCRFVTIVANMRHEVKDYPRYAAARCTACMFNNSDSPFCAGG